MRASSSDAYRTFPSHSGPCASDSADWIDKADLKRVSGALAQSADVINAARQDLGEPGGSVPGLTGPDGSKDFSQPADPQRQVLEERRKRLRRLLRQSDGVAVGVQQIRRSEEGVVAVAKETGKPGFQGADVSAQQYDVTSQGKGGEGATSDAQLDRPRGHPHQKASPAPNFPEDLVSASWTQRFDHMINVVTGALAITLLICSTLSASILSPHSKSSAAVADVGVYAQMRSDNPRPLEAPPLQRGTQGFDLLSGAYPESLPAIAEDIPTMLFYSGPWRFSKPGI